MRNVVVMASLVAAIATCALVVGAGVAGADPGNGAIVNRGSGVCQIGDSSGNYWNFDCTIHSVITPQGQVNEYVSGPVDDVFGLNSALPTSADHDVTTDTGGFLCDFVNGGYTTITQGVVTPGGQVKLTCRS